MTGGLPEGFPHKFAQEVTQEVGPGDCPWRFAPGGLPPAGLAPAGLPPVGLPQRFSPEVCPGCLPGTQEVCQEVQTKLKVLGGFT